MPILSVLDQSPVPAGSTAADALRNSVDLAVRTEQLGYQRYWVAEHHNSDGLAGSSPEILIGAIASATSAIRVGSGGVMLMHYSPLKVAENFKLLAALHGDRIDLGLGRAPGSDPLTAAVLGGADGPRSAEYYPSDVEEVRRYLHDEPAIDARLSAVRARPTVEHPPEMWLLASSIDSASIAAHLGLPLSWAYFIANGGAEITQAYREQYMPSLSYPQPRLSLGVAAIAADTADEAEALASSLREWRARGLGGPIPHPGEGTASPANPLLVREARPAKPLISGTGPQVRDQLDALAEEYGADELLIVTICHDHAARVRSYELIAEAYQ